ncbi:hypothetical protein FS837_006463 [Tulasnella sp. UAMH 9824]|nr:hypothetical protein FS837_006463 [Tulasnella sp. UAMH 9824]
MFDIETATTEPPPTYQPTRRSEALSPCLSTTPISSCVADRPALPLVDFVRNAMANVPYVILTYDQKLLFASVMSAILARMVVVALSVALQGFPMLTTARSVHA